MGCGTVTAKTDLRRVVLSAGRLQADAAKRRPGRGAYVCDRACAEQALRRGGFARSFRSAVLVDPDLLDSV